MGFVSDLFGGTETKQTTGPVDVVPPEFRALRKPVAGALEGLIGTGLAQGGGTPSGEGIFTAPITGQESSLVGRLGELVGGPTPLRGAVEALLQNTVEGQFLTPGSNPFLGETIRAAQRPVIEAFQDVALPRFQRGFTAAGQFIQPQGSSAFDRAAAIATRGLTNTLGDISTNIASQNFQAERGRQAQAVEQVSQLSSADVNNTIAGLQASALPRLIEQFGINQGTAEFNRRISIVLQALGVARGLPLVQTGQQSTATSTTSPNILGPILGAAAGPFFGSLFAPAIGAGAGSFAAGGGPFAGFSGGFT